MIVMNIIGGLGNQMFQYATGLSIARQLGTDLKLDVFDYKNYDLHRYQLGIFQIEPQYATRDDVSRMIFSFLDVPQRIYYRLTGGRRRPHGSYYHETVHPDAFFEIMDAKADDAYMYGYWQNEKHFIDISEDIFEAFTLRDPLSEKAFEWKSRIESNNSVSMHVRRGDYISNPDAAKVFSQCDETYYRSAVEHISQFMDDPHFFVFSDDLEWVEANFGWLTNKTPVEGVPEAYEEMALMSTCDHNIIANSSFSWWGAWLNQNPDKIVIAPKEWYKEKDGSKKVPQTWIRL